MIMVIQCIFKKIKKEECVNLLTKAVVHFIKIIVSLHQKEITMKQKYFKYRNKSI